MSSVLGFDLGHTGILAALPYLARLIFGFVFGSIGDQIRKKNWMTTTTTRKSFVLFCKFIVNKKRYRYDCTYYLFMFF